MELGVPVPNCRSQYATASEGARCTVTQQELCASSAVSQQQQQMLRNQMLRQRIFSAGNSVDMPKKTSSYGDGDGADGYGGSSINTRSGTGFGSVDTVQMRCCGGGSGSRSASGPTASWYDPGRSTSYRTDASARNMPRCPVLPSCVLPCGTTAMILPDPGGINGGLAPRTTVMNQPGFRRYF